MSGENNCKNITVKNQQFRNIRFKKATNMQRVLHSIAGEPMPRAPLPIFFSSPCSHILNRCDLRQMPFWPPECSFLRTFTKYWTFTKYHEIWQYRLQIPFFFSPRRGACHSCIVHKASVNLPPDLIPSRVMPTQFDEQRIQAAFACQIHAQKYKHKLHHSCC